jgi:hypothetical protein
MPMTKRERTFADEVVSGDRRRALEATRKVLAERITQAEPKETAPLVNQLRAVLAELADLPEGKARSVVDDLAAKRARRTSGRAASGS